MREKCVQMKLSRYYYETQLKDEKEVQNTWIKMRALGEEFREKSRNIPRTWIEVQACRHKINITSGSLQHLDIQNELGWGSDECCVETSTGSWMKLPAHPKKIKMNSRSLRDWVKSERDLVKLSALPKRIEMSSRESPDRCWTTWGGGGRVWIFSSPEISTHFLLLFLTEWFWNSVAESWSSRGTGTWGRHQLWAREGNVLS